MRSESARPGKRPMRALSAGEKMEAIQRVHEGESKASVARDIGVPESTLRGWCKSEHKIRGMARNSSTPDSEAHSPASSSGTNHLTLASGGANHSSEDESPAAKRAKIDQHHQHHTGIPSSSFCTNENSENEASRLSDASKIDYVSLMASMASMRPEHSSLLMQQLGLQFGAAATSSFAKTLLSLPATLPHSSAVGLVENGLQYTRGSNNNNGKRHSTSAIAPAQIDSVAKSGTRKSLPPAAEAPFSPVPASPRKTNDLYHHHHHLVQQQQQQQQQQQHQQQQQQHHHHHHHHQQQQQQQQQQQHQQQQQQHHHHQPREAHTNNKTKEQGVNKKGDDQLWMWLTQQQALLGQQSTPFTPSNQNDGSWFWQWYKQCSLPLMTPTSNSQTTIAKKSPSKARALLDTVLCNNNNNENVRRSFNDVGTHDIDGNQVVDDTQVISPEEAIEHADKFLMWLDKCSEPAVTRLQIMQFKYLLDSLKSCRSNRPTSMIKHSRK